MSVNLHMHHSFPGQCIDFIKRKKKALRLSAAVGSFLPFLDTLMLGAAVSTPAKTEKLRNNKAEVLSAHAVIK